MSNPLIDDMTFYRECSECGETIRYSPDLFGRVYPLSNQAVFVGHLLTTDIDENGIPTHLKIEVITCSRECLIKKLHSVEIKHLKM